MQKKGLCVITRRPSETIEVVAPNGDIITIMLVQIKSKGYARLGIRAPDGYAIHRDTAYAYALLQEDEDATAHLPPDAHLKTHTGLDVS